MSTKLNPEGVAFKDSATQDQTLTRMLAGVLQVSTDDGATWSDVGTGGTIPDGSVTLAKLANLSAKTVVGRETNSTGVPQAMTMTQLTADLNAATTSLQGMLTAVKSLRLDNMQLLPAIGTDLTDADATIQPFTDHCSLYVLRGPLTQNRTLTVGITGADAFGPFSVIILVLDTSAFTYTIRNSTPTTLYTHAASGQKTAYTLFTAGGGVFGTNVAQYALTP